MVSSHNISFCDGVSIFYYEPKSKLSEDLRILSDQTCHERVGSKFIERVNSFPFKELLIETFYVPVCRLSMANKRKRKHPSKTHTDEPRKRLRSDVDEISTSLPAKHPTLSLYYPRIKSLRNYLLDSLLVSSKSRRRKIASFGLSRLQSHTSIPPASSSTCNEESIASNFGHEDHLSCHDNEEYLARLLDTTLVGVTGDAPPELGKSRAEDFASFSQQVSSTIGSSVGRGSSSQSEVGAKPTFHLHRPSSPLCW